MSSSTANCHILLGARTPAHAVASGSHSISQFPCSLRAERPFCLGPGSEEPGSFPTAGDGAPAPACSPSPAHLAPRAGVTRGSLRARILNKDR